MQTKFYKNNRKRLGELLADNSFCLLFAGVSLPKTADEDFGFQINTNFYYLSGITQAGSALLFVKREGKTECFLYVDPYDEMYEKWIGHRLTKKEASAMSGIAMTQIRFTDRLEEDVALLGKECKWGYFDLEQHDCPVYESLGQKAANTLPKSRRRDAWPLIVSLREAKTEEEVECLRRAIEVTHHGLSAILSHIAPGMTEYQAEAYFDFTVKTEGNRPLSFPTIAAAGGNATTLHYSKNDTVIKDGDLVLFDLGCQDEGYRADITRTYPANGKFTELQRTIYNIVLSANKKVAEVAKAGMTTLELQQVCIATLTEGCLAAGLIEDAEELKNYYYHGVSHSIGLDTHDPRDRKAPLPVGAVISNEPGLYFAKYNIGIRIEDDLLLTKDGCINLSPQILKEADEIEAFMREQNPSVKK